MDELKERLVALKGEIREVAGKVGLTPDELASLNGQLAEVEQIKSQIAALEVAEGIEDMSEKVNEEVKAEIDALKGEIEALKAANVEARRLPEAPAVAKFADTWKYDNLDVGEHALAVSILNGARHLPNAQAPSDAMVKGLALKIESEAGKDLAANAAMGPLNKVLTAKAIKANDLAYSTLASYGDEWVGVAYGRDLWEKIRAETWVVDRLQSQGMVINIPDGFESSVLPIEGTDPRWYKVAQTTAHNATTGFPDATVTASKLGTAQRSITVAKMGCRAGYTGEMVEDSLIAYVQQLRRQMTASGAEMMEHAVINGDTDLTINTNINDIAGTPAGTEVFTLVDGFRKLGLITNTNNARSAGTLTEEDYLETVILMGNRGQNAFNAKERVTLIPCAATYLKSLQLASVKTQDVWTRATLAEGELRRMWGFEVRPSYWMHYDESGSVTGAYVLLAQTDGKVDIDTATDNTTGAILAVRWDQWAFAWKRRMTMEVTRYPRSDSSEIVALARWGLTYRDTDAAAISYNVTV